MYCGALGGWLAATEPGQREVPGFASPALPPYRQHGSRPYECKEHVCTGHHNGCVPADAGRISLSSSSSINNIIVIIANHLPSRGRSE